MEEVVTIDSLYAGLSQVASVYLVTEGEFAVLVETNTTHAIPKILEQMKELQIPPQNLEYVIVTHVHLDHAGGTWAILEACPNAIVLAHPKTAKHLIDPKILIASAKKVYGEENFLNLYGEIHPVPKDRVRIMENGEGLDWRGHKFTFLYTKGHANHHFCIYDSKLNGIFTGDSFGISYPHLENGNRFIFPTTTPTDFDAKEAILSLDKIVNTGAKQAYLTHFGAVSDLQKKAEDLKIGLEDCGTIVESLIDVSEENRLPFAESKVKEMIQKLADLNSVVLTKKDWELLDLDVNLNAQGLLYAFQKSLSSKSA